ncbi:MAG: adenosylcobinamide-GDP ribazoletransferase, partial [Candidatus Competibacteraceae bacterium]|nr:adenosylcobinamide-GDP ribazoletransferase [Candidatus Competibacteraceae bacterium]
VLLAVLWLLLTGGLHMDGLMDTADGIFSHQSRERMLEIMHDPRVGNFGVLSGVSVLLIKITGMAALSGSGLSTVLLIAPDVGASGGMLRHRQVYLCQRLRQGQDLAREHQLSFRSNQSGNPAFCCQHRACLSRSVLCLELHCHKHYHGTEHCLLPEQKTARAHRRYLRSRSGVERSLFHSRIGAALVNSPQLAGS